MADETLELPDLVQLAVRRGVLNRDDALAAAQEAVTTEVDVRDVLLDRDLLDPQDLDVLERLQNPRSLVPGYELLDVLGQGAMGVVYAARQLNLDRRVALKTVKLARLDDPASVRRARAEARIVAGLAHPNITTAFDHGVHEGRIFLAMEFVEGESWLDRIERTGPCDERTVWFVARQVAAGLAHAAERGVVHRDVKPANVLLTKPPAGFDLPRGIPLAKVTDFGIARNSGSEQATRITATGAGLGTPDYVAPEQILDSDVDLRADVYALGVSVYHSLNGATPFETRTVMDVVRSKMAGDDSWRHLPTYVSSRTDELLRAMTAHDREDRPGDYQTLLARIDGILDADRDRPTEEGLPSPRPRRQRRPIPRSGRRAALIAAILLSCGLLAVVPFALSTAPSEPKPVDGLRRDAVIYPFVPDEVPRGRKVGTWDPTTDPFGGKRHSGRNGWLLVERPVASEFGEFRFGCDLDDAEAVEVQFPVDPSDPKSGRRFVLRVTDTGVELGSRPSVNGTFSGRNRVERGTPESEDPEGRYYTSTIAWQPDAWFANFEGTDVGWVVPESVDGSAILLRVVGGTAHFENVQLVEMVPTG